MLNLVYTQFVEERGKVIGRNLPFGAINGNCQEMRGMLGSGRRRVTECSESLWDIVGHRNVHLVSVIIPVDLETQVACTGPIS